MPRIEKSNTVAFKVELTEFERGWGRSEFGAVYFDNEAEAKQYALDYNNKYNNKEEVPSWYVRADYAGQV